MAIKLEVRGGLSGDPSTRTYDDEREVRDGLTSEERLSITGEQL